MVQRASQPPADFVNDQQRDQQSDQSPDQQENPNDILNAVRWLARRTVFLLLLMAALFVSAGRSDWPGAWIFVGIYAISTAITGLILIPNNMDLIHERNRGGDNIKPWDRWLAPLMALLMPLALWVAAGLEVRFSGTVPAASPICAAGVVLGIAAQAIGIWALAANPFFSGVVRIQHERGHRTIQRGPYGGLRHPAYAAYVVYAIATALLLQSTWAAVLAVPLIGVTILRTALEDRTLRAELPGYAAYADRVRFRLLPGIW